MLYKIDRMIKPELRQRLLDLCPLIKELNQAISLALQQVGIVDKVEKSFVVAPHLAVSHSDPFDRQSPPVFELTDVDVRANILAIKDKEKRRQIGAICERVKDAIEEKYHFPIKIDFRGKATVLKDLPEVYEAFCTPEEAKRMRQKAVKPFENSKQWIL